jgi:RNA polymerase sigma factor (sigma-70 family)
MKTIRILLVDDHEIVRTGLHSFLNTQQGLQVVAEAGSGSEALEKIADSHPDVVIMDITMPDMDGFKASRLIKSSYPAVHLLALTVHSDKQYMFAMLASGASGYVTKHSAAEELVAAIHAVAKGHVYLQPALARWLLEDYRRLAAQALETAAHPSRTEASAIPPDLEVLTRREQEVLRLVAEGNTNPQIGKQLGISHKTVARHRERIMKKLKLHSNTELVKFAIRTGLIEIG